MRAILPADIVAELERTIAGCAPDRCARMLWRTTDLLVAGHDRLQGHEISALDEVLIRLAARAEPAALVQLSAVLAELKVAPGETLRRLAFHDDPAVAGPVLLKSPMISSQDLKAIGSAHGEQHLLAIARRGKIDAGVTDILLQHGSRTVHMTLINNPGADLSEAGYAILVSRAADDGELTKALALRPGVPDAILRELLSATPKEVKAPPPAPAAGPQRRTVNYSDARPEIIALNRIGKLNDSTVNRFAIRGESASLITALSVLSGAPVEIIEHVIADADCEGVVMACRASRLNWQTTLSILNHRGTARLSYEDRGRAQQLFETLYLSTSQWTVRWGELAARASSSSADRKVAKSGASR